MESLTHDELRGLLNKVSEIRVTDTGHGFEICVPAIDKRVILVPDKIIYWRIVCDPFGDDALFVEIQDTPNSSYQFIVAPRDMVFEPDASDSGLGLGNSINFGITDLPPLVSYAEIARGLKKIKSGLASPRFDTLLAHMIMIRYFLNGAKRAGVDCEDLSLEWQDIARELSLDKLAEMVKGGDGENNPD